MNNKQTLSLYEVTQKIIDAIDSEFPGLLWVIGEISEIKENISGHCYLELVEKDKKNEQPKAKARGTIWARNYRMIRPFFERAAGRKLSSGIKVLVQCTVNYHPIYGFSLNIVDIDPTFTIGDIEMQRQETINKLIAEGVMDMNKQTLMPILPKRIAVISSPTAAGFEDFTNQLENNPYGYAFHIKLFNAVMQGDKAENSIIQALDRIHESIDNWDVVIIIRGGGSQIDLGCFDSYNIANNIAQFPIPIITGIGHEKDVTIADMVAHSKQKTPTAVAEFLIAQFINAENWLEEANNDFTDAVNQKIQSNVDTLNRIGNQLVPLVIKTTQAASGRLQKTLHLGQDITSKYITKHNIILHKKGNQINTQSIVIRNKELAKLNQHQKLLTSKIRGKLTNEHNNLLHVEKNLTAVDPINVLKRGYSITTQNGKLVKSVNELAEGNTVETTISTGKFTSIINSIKQA